VAYCGQFLSIDEYGILDALLGPDRAALIEAHLQASALRTTLALYGPLVGTGFLGDWSHAAAAFFKLSHWFTGFLAFLVVFHLLDGLTRGRLLGYCAFMMGLLVCFPLNQTALKTFNYDVLSMTLGLMAMIGIVRACQTSSAWFALAALGCAYLAGQE